MKFISLLLCFCFTFNVLAASGTVQEFEKQIDDYQYSLTVDWDQKDQEFYEQKTQDFFHKLSVLMEQGLTQEEVIALADKKMANKTLSEAFKLKLNLLSKNANSAEELAKLLKENSKEFYQNGASWNGEVMGYIGIGVLAAALIGYAIWFGINYKCVAYDYRYECDTLSNGRRECDYEKYCSDYEKR